MDRSRSTRNSETLLMDLAKSGKLSHAVIIETDNVQAAYEFFINVAKAALCTGSSRPCGECGNCIKAESGSHADIKVTETSEKIRSIKIDEIRKIREDAYISSNEGGGKFYIIKNAEYMTVQAQNALIKILEEPPKNVTFVMICEFSENLLSTIRSRSHIFKFNFDKSGAEDDILSLAEKISKASLNSENDKILECVASFGNDRKSLKRLIESITDCLIYYFKDEKISDSMANSLILKVDELKKLSSLVDKNVNINLLICVMCSCL